MGRNKDVVNVIQGNNCPVIEQTAGGVSVGRCWIWLKDGVCSRHGDVSLEKRKYETTGKLTLESELRKRHD